MRGNTREIKGLLGGAIFKIFCLKFERRNFKLVNKTIIQTVYWGFGVFAVVMFVLDDEVSSGLRWVRE